MHPTQFYFNIFAIFCLLLDCNSSMLSTQSKENWSGNVKFKAVDIQSPQNLEELKDMIKHSKKVKVVGTRHSFNDLADTEGTHISLQHFKLIECCQDNMVTIGAGITYAELVTELKTAHKAITTSTSLPHINVIGSIVTGSHGGANGQNIIANYVQEFTIVDSAGQEKVMIKGDEAFDDLLLSLGYLGVITQVKIKVEPAFEVLKCIYQHMPYKEFSDNFDDLMAGKDYVSFFTNFSNSEIDSLWFGFRLDAGHRKISSDMCPLGLYDARLVLKKHPFPGHDGSNCTKSGRGTWAEKIFLFSPDHPPSMTGQELGTEIFVAPESILTVLDILFQNHQIFKDVLQVAEIRPVSSDEFLMSPAYQQNVVAIHFAWYQKPHKVKQVMAEIHSLIGKQLVGVHWAKLFEMGPHSLRKLYGSRLDKFLQLTQSLDPTSKFRNRFFEKHFRPLIENNQSSEDL